MNTKISYEALMEVLQPRLIFAQRPITFKDLKEIFDEALKLDLEKERLETMLSS